MNTQAKRSFRRRMLQVFLLAHVFYYIGINLFAHARDSQGKVGIRIRVDIFRVLSRSLPLYSRICTTDDG